jgi:hypothetical protein
VIAAEEDAMTTRVTVGAFLYGLENVDCAVDGGVEHSCPHVRGGGGRKQTTMGSLWTS